MRRLIWPCLLVILASLAHARMSAQEPQTVSLKSGDETVQAYLARPSAEGAHPALIVIHEWWGLNDWVKEQAERFAQQGYVALAVDLYRGKSTRDASEAQKLARGLPRDRAVRNLKAAFDYLASRPDVMKDRIGSIGWCMGGGLALELAVREPRLAACVVHYGAMPTDPASIEKIQAPVFGIFGADDHSIPPSAVHAFEKAMQAARKTVFVKIYDSAGHAFENPENKANYRQDAAVDAWARTLGFLGQTLKR